MKSRGKAFWLARHDIPGGRVNIFFQKPAKIGLMFMDRSCAGPADDNDLFQFCPKVRPGEAVKVRMEIVK